MKQQLLFTNQDLKNMVIPLFFEQLLVMLVGLADTIIVSYAGETASRLLSFSCSFAIILSFIILIADKPILKIMFGQVEADVMNACVIYLRISAYSYPTIAIYNAGISMFRSFGDTKTAMNISAISNIINIVGNLLGVFVFKAGVAGVAYPSFIARVFSAVVITVLCFKKNNAVSYHWKYILSWSGNMIKNILRIAICILECINLFIHTVIFTFIRSERRNKEFNSHSCVDP